MNILLCLVVIFGSLLTLGLVMTTVFVIYLFIDSLIKGDSKEFTVLTGVLSLFGIGASDITDVITNTAGTAAGAGFYCILNLCLKNTEKIDSLLRILAAICTVIMLLMFAILLK